MPTHADRGPREAVQRQVAMLEERKRAAALEFADGSLPADMLRAIATDLQSRIDALRDIQIDLHVDMQTVKWVNFPFENFDALDVHAQHAAIRMFVSRIVLLPAGRGSSKFNPDLVQIEWRDLSNFRFNAIVESPRA